MVKTTLHVFADDSMVAYGVVVHLCSTVEAGTMTTSLLLNKSRITSWKDILLARLEHLECLLATRLLCFVKSKFKEKIDEEYLLSDSKIASALLDNWRCKQMEAVCLEQSSRNPEEHQATGVETMCRKKKSCQPHHQRFRCLKLLENEGWWQGLLWLMETSLSGHPSRAWKHCAWPNQWREQRLWAFQQ